MKKIKFFRDQWRSVTSNAHGKQGDAFNNSKHKRTQSKKNILLQGNNKVYI